MFHVPASFDPTLEYRIGPSRWKFVGSSCHPKKTDHHGENPENEEFGLQKFGSNMV